MVSDGPSAGGILRNWVLVAHSLASLIQFSFCFRDLLENKNVGDHFIRLFKHPIHFMFSFCTLTERSL